MKRVGFLIDKIADIDNLRFSFYKAQTGQQGKRDVIKYRENLQSNLELLRQQILFKNIKVGNYQLFKIFDPKERTVCAASFNERVLHHAIINICGEYFERHFISTTYANRKNKGVYKALDLAHFATSHYRFVAKLDVRKYFDSIDHYVLKFLLRRLFKDKCLLYLLDQIIDSYHVEENKGLPIGNLTSQYFANYYLSGLDHYVKEVLLVPIYIRYMDDILLFGNDLDLLKEQVRKVTLYVCENLRLQLKIPIIQKTIKPFTFLGYSFCENKITLAKRSRFRFEEKYYRMLKMF